MNKIMEKDIPTKDESEILKLTRQSTALMIDLKRETENDCFRMCCNYFLILF